MIEIMPATADIVQRFFGHQPVHTVRALVAMRGDQVIGLAGLCRTEGAWYLFADLTPEIRKDRRAIIRGIRAITALARRRAVPVMAVAHRDTPGSRTLLEHMGFEPMGFDAPDGEVYLWHN